MQYIHVYSSSFPYDFSENSLVLFIRVIFSLLPWVGNWLLALSAPRFSLSYDIITFSFSDIFLPAHIWVGVPDPLDLELQRVVSCLVAAENQTQILWKSNQCF